MQASNLMGLGLHPFLAQYLGNTLNIVSATGTNAANGTKLSDGGNKTYYINAGGSGTAGVTLPNIGGSPGCLLGDFVVLVNAGGGTVLVYAPGGYTLISSGTSYTTNTAYSLANGKLVMFYSCTNSVYAMI